MGEVRCDKLRERDAQSVLSGFLTITDSLQLETAGCTIDDRLPNDS